VIDSEKLEILLAQGESIDLEFKSERLRRISDKEICEDIVALANTSGGILLLGVEDDGKVTGARPRHGQATDRFRFQSAIFNNTVPSINTRISVLEYINGVVVAIEVDPYPEPWATASGKSLRRVLGADGKPQTVPFYPRDQRSRRVDLGLLDYSAQKMDLAGFAAFVYEQDKRGTPLSMDELIALNELLFARRTDSERLGMLIQKGTVEARRVLERLHERGFIEAKGEKKGRVYHLASSLYQRLRMTEAYIRTKGFQPIQQEQMVLEYVRSAGRITRSQAADLCHLSTYQATRLLLRMVEKFHGFERQGKGKATHYIWVENDL